MAISHGYFVEQLRDYHSEFDKLSDEEVYLKGIQLYPDEDVQKWAGAFEWRAENKPPQKPQIDSSPGFFSSLISAYGGDVDENTSWVVRNAYANSLHGMAIDYFVDGGITDYNLEDYNPNVLEEAASAILSFTMPLDIITLGVGGGIGGLGVKAAATPIKAMAISGSKAAAKRGLSKYANSKILQSTAGRIIGEGIQFGVYEGAKANLGARLSGEDPLLETFHGVGHGMLMGAVLGGVGGYLGSTNEKLALKLYQLDKMKKSGRAMKGFDLRATEASLNKAFKYTGKVPQYLSTVTALTGVGTALSEEDVTLDNLFRDFIVNSAFIGVMKGTGPLLRKATKELDFYKNRVLDANIDKAVRESSDSVKDMVADYESGIDKMDIPDAAKDIVKSKLAEGVNEIDTLIREGDKAETLDLLQSRLRFFGNMLDKSDDSGIADIILDKKTRSEFVETVRATQDALNESKKILPDAKKAYAKELDSLIEEFDDVLSPRALKIKTDVKNKVEADDAATRARAEKMYNDSGKKLTSLKNWKKDPIDTIRRIVDELEPRQVPGDTSGGTKLFPIKSRKDFIADLKKELKEQYADDPGERQSRYKEAASAFDRLLKEGHGEKNPYEEGSKEAKMWNTKWFESMDIVMSMVQSYHTRSPIATVGGTSGFITNPGLRSGHLMKFARHLINKHGMSIKDLKPDDSAIILDYLAKNKPQVEMIKDLNNSLSLRIDKTSISKYRETGKGVPGAKGVRTNAKSLWDWTGNVLNFISSKTKERVTKYISNFVQEGMTRLSKKSGRTAGDTDYLFRDTSGVAFSNRTLNILVEHVFGEKVRDTKEGVARSFRHGMKAWARFQKEVNIRLKLDDGKMHTVKLSGEDAAVYIHNWVLYDKEKLSSTGKVYGQGDSISIAQAIVKRFIKDVLSKKDIKMPISNKHYTVSEIRAGLAKIKNIQKEAKKSKREGEITVATSKKGRVKRTISADDAEVLFRYMIETAPRLNEIVAERKTIQGSRDYYEGVEYQLGRGKGVAEFDVEFSNQLKWLREKYPDVVLNLEDTIGKVSGQYVMGRIIKNAVDISLKQADPDTLPHEISHYATNILEAIGTPEAKRLLARGDKMFKGREGLVDSIGKHVRQLLKGNDSVKARTWTQQFWDYIRSFFGVESKDQIVRNLGKTVAERNIPEKIDISILSSKPDYQIKKDMTRKKINSTVFLRQKGRGRDRKTLGERKYISQLNKDIKDAMGYEKETKYKSITEVDLIELIRYYDWLDLAVKKDGSSLGYTGKQNSAIKKFTLMNFDEKEQSDLLKSVGVRSGKWEDASKNQVNMLMAYAKEFGKDVSPETKMGSLAVKLDKMNFTMPNGWSTFGTPVYIVLKRSAESAKRQGKIELSNTLYKIEQAMVDHSQFYESWLGESRKIEKKIYDVLGKNKHLIAYVSKTHDRTRLSDKEQAVFETKEWGQAEKMWRNLGDHLWNGIIAVVEKQLPKAQFEQWKKEYNRKYVDDYMHNSVNPELVDAMVSGRFGSNVPIVEKMFNDMLNKSAKSEAKKNKKGDSAAIVIEEERLKNNDEFRRDIYEDVLNRFLFSPAELENKFELERGVDLPFDVEIYDKNGKKKKVESYVKNEIATLEKYVLGMTSFLSHLKFFPEWTKVGKKYNIGNIRGDIAKSFVNDQSMGSYIHKAVTAHMGLNYKDLSERQKMWSRNLGYAANTGAALGLTSPIFSQAQKNVVLGTIQTVGMFGLRRTLRGINFMLQADNWDKARATGWGESGTHAAVMAQMELPVISSIFKGVRMDKILKLSGMLQTEQLNRVIAGYTSQLTFDTSLRAYAGESGLLRHVMDGTVGKVEFERLMDEVWQFSPEQIGWVKKLKIEDLDKESNRSKLTFLKRKAGHWGHSTTQGATSTFLLPLWMSKEYVKPLTLFSRIAASVTHNVYRNAIRPIYTHKNIMPLLRIYLGSQVGGSALWGMYEWAFEQENPTSQESNTEQLFANLWRTEFLGVFSETINPYTSPLFSKEGKSAFLTNASVTDSSSVLYLVRAGVDTADSTLKFLGEASGERRGFVFKQLLNDWVTRTSVATAQASKVMYSLTKPRSSVSIDVKRVETLKRKWMQSKKYRPHEEYTATMRTPFYRRIKESFWDGTEEDQAKAYWMALNVVATDLEQNEGYTSVGSYKEARKILKQTISNINPIGLSVDMNNKRISKTNEFLGYLDDDMKDFALKTEKNYQWKKRIFWKNVLKGSHRDRWSAYFDNFAV